MATANVTALALKSRCEPGVNAMAISTAAMAAMAAQLSQGKSHMTTGGLMGVGALAAPAQDDLGDGDGHVHVHDQGAGGAHQKVEDGLGRLAWRR